MTFEDNNVVSRRNVAKEAFRRGFTLVELLVVVAILGILGTIAIQNVTGHLASTRITAAETAVQQLKGACVSYSLKHKGKYPTSLDQLIEGDDPILEGGEGALVDPWDNKYEIEKKGKDNVVVKSAGPDGEMGTDDDIRTDKTKKSSNKE